MINLKYNPIAENHSYSYDAKTNIRKIPTYPMISKYYNSKSKSEYTVTAFAKSFRRSTIRSPLRYPGGKSRALKYILPLIPDFEEYRELFVGGGSVFIEVKQRLPNKKYWINDIDKELYLFWRFSKSNAYKLVKEIKKIKDHTKDGKKLYERYKGYNMPNNNLSNFERAVRYFILNRISFSGLVGSGGYSEQAFKKRFTDSSIENIYKMKNILKNVKITNKDYKEILNKEGEGVFLFLDPPYYSSAHSKLYGNKGDLHIKFNHDEFAKKMKYCKHMWLITYDDCPEIRERFKWANMYVWKLQYGMNNFSNKNKEKGKELFISNYPIPHMKAHKIEE